MSTFPQVSGVRGDTLVAGTITTQNLVPAGAATAGSSVSAFLTDGASSLAVQVTGTYTGALSLQGTVNGSVWVTVGGTVFFNVTTGASSATIASAAVGIFQAECSGFTAIRISALAAVTGTASVTLALGKATSLVSLDTTSPVSQSGTWTVMPGNTANTTPWLANPGIPTTSFVNSAATTNATSVKASAGTVYSVTASNTSASARYLKFYNKASAPTVGTDVPVLTLALPASGGLQNVIFGTLGLRFSTGVALAITAGAADSDTAVIAANEVKVCTAYL